MKSNIKMKKMKVNFFSKVIFMFLSVGAILVACDKDEKPIEAPSIMAQTDVINLEALSGKFSISLISNVDWKASSSLEGVSFNPTNGIMSETTQLVEVSYPENTGVQSRDIELVFRGKAPFESVVNIVKISQYGVVEPKIIVENTEISVDGKSQTMDVTLTSSNVSWKAISLNSKFIITDNESGGATLNPVVIKVKLPENVTLSDVEGLIEIQKNGTPEIKTDVRIKQGLHPKNDETLVYSTPSKTASELLLDRGVAHPNIKIAGWKFWNAHEFTSDAIGFWNFETKLGIVNAVYSNGMKEFTSEGTLKLKTKKLASPTTNSFGDPAEYETATLYSKRHHQGGAKWVKFTKNMRVEVRYRQSGHSGFNEAIWFMGQSNYDGQGIKWPACGEIDLMEAPYQKQSHFSLHTASFSVVNNNAVTKHVTLVDDTKWNIYWVEILDDKIIGGVNGYQYFSHEKGDNGNYDWPWDNPAGMMMIFTPGIGSWGGKTMPNLAAGEEAFMEIDWIRVYTNNSFDATSQSGHDYKGY